MPAQLVDGGEQIPLAGHVGEEDQPGLRSQADLLHGPDGDIVIPEDLGNGGQHPGPANYVNLLSKTALMQGFNALDQWGRFEEALQLAEDCTTAVPTYPDGHFARGRALAGAGGCCRDCLSFAILKVASITREVTAPGFGATICPMGQTGKRE